MVIFVLFVVFLWWWCGGVNIRLENSYFSVFSKIVVARWCFCSFVVMFCGGVVLLWWCGVFVVVFLCLCGGVFVVVW